MRLGLCILFCCFLMVSLRAQHLRIEPQVNLFSVTQQGWIYTPIGTHTPPIGYAPTLIDKNSTLPGFGCTAWHPLNFGTPLYEFMAYGVESGFILNGGTQDESVFPPAEILRWNVRLPIMAGIRFGTAIQPYNRKYGLGISAGMEMIRTALSNETGTYFIPKIQVIGGVRSFFLGLAFYPTSISSYYTINGEKTDRLTTSLFEFQARTAISWYPKRYRVTVKQKPQ